MKITIGRKIAFPFFVMFILIVGVAGITYQGFKKVSASLDNMQLESVKRGGAGNLRFSITQLLMASNDYVITQKQYYKREFDRINSVVDNAYHEFTQLPLTDEEQRITEHIKQDLDSIRAYSAQIFSIPNPRMSPKAWELMETLDYHFGEYVNKKTTQIFDGISKRIEEYQSQAAEVKENANTSIFVVTFLGILISIVVAFITVRRISKPIVNVAKAADSIANGDYSQRPVVSTRDEIALLASSFSQMAEAIEASHRKLELSKRFTENIVATVPSGLLAIGKNLEVLSINRSFRNLFNVIHQQVVGQTVNAVLQTIGFSQKCRDAIAERMPFRNLECLCSIPGKGELTLNLTLSGIHLAEEEEEEEEALLVIDNITERKRAEEELAEREKRYSALFNLSPSGIVLEDTEGNIVDVNDAFCKSLGYTREELVGKNVRMVASPEQIPAIEHHIALLRSGKMLEHVVQDVRKDGTLCWMELHETSISLASGQQGFLVVAHDITERKRAEEESRLLLTLTQAVAVAEDFPSALTAALQLVCDSMAWDFGEAWIPSRDGTHLELSSSWYCRVQNVESFHTASERFKFAPGVGLPGRVWASKKPAWIPDVTVDPNFPRAPFAKDVGLHAAVGIPILANSDVVAVICFFLRQLRQEDERMVALVSAVAAQLGTLFQRKRAEEELLKISTAIEQTADCVVITDRDGIIQYVNQAFTKIFGYSKEEVLGKTPRILKSELHPPEFYKKLWETILFGEVFTETFINKRKDGELIYEIKTITPIKDKEGHITHFVSTAKEITEQRRAEEKLRKSEERMRIALKNSPIVVYNQDVELRYTWIYNPHPAFTVEQILGKTDFDLLIPEDAAEVTAMKRQVLETGAGSRKEIKLTIEGGEFYYDLTVEPLRDGDGTIIGITAAAMEITEHRRAEQEIVSQKNRFAQLFENSPIAIALLDDQDKVVVINESFSVLFGYYLEEIKGKSLTDLIVSSQFKEEADAYSMETMRGNQVNKESYRKKKDGTLVYVQIVGIPVIVNEKTVGIYGMYVDLTQRKKAEEKMKIAKELAEQSDKLKDAFIANISHEIRTPLNAIMGYTDMIGDTFSQHASEIEIDYFQAVNEASNRLMRTIELILNFSRVYIGEFPINLQPINLSSIISNLINVYNLTARKKSLELSFENKYGDVILIADEYSITQAVSNLIDNAIKYTKQGFVKLVLYSYEENELMLDVIDSGIGISEKYLKQIFEPYSQEEIGYGRSYEGIGLGLSIVKKFLALNEADISVQSTKGKGSTFIIHFKKGTVNLPKENYQIHSVPTPSGFSGTEKSRRSPTSLPANPELTRQAGRDRLRMRGKSEEKSISLQWESTPTSSGEVKREKKSTILVVEDDELNQQYIQTSLKNNYNTIIVSSAHEALEILNVKPIKLIIMDISLKGELNGLELTKIIRETEEYSKIPIIVVTAHAFPEDRQRSLEAGCNKYLSKPFKANELLESITELIKKK